MKTKSIIATLLLAASSAFAQVPSYVPTNGLVGWWPFNGNANDESGNGNNGINSGATLSTDRFGSINSAYSFNGTSNEISITDSLLNLVSDFTISCWMNSSDTTKIQQCIFNSISHTGFVVELNNENLPPNKLMYGIGPANAFWDLIYAHGTYNLFQNNVWYHIVFVKSGTLYSLYQNNQFDGSSVVSASTGYNQSVGIRFGSIGGTEFFKGKLDDFGAWNRALTPQEITALYNAQTCNSSSNAITADGPTTFCAGNYVNLTSDVVGGTYQWKKNGVNISTNGTSRTYKATATGSYTCVATCNGTALTSNAIQVTSQTNAAVTLTATGATSFCAGDSVTLNATNLGSGYSVQWYRTNISMQGATNYSVVVKQPGTYKTVTKNLSNGCSRISSGSITTAVNCRMSNPDIIAVDPVNDEIPATKLGNSTETAMHLFPNPNAGSFTLEYDGIEADFEVQVLNTMGQIIYNDIIPSNEKHLKTSINLGDNMQKGIYVVRIINGENVHESKVMLQ